MDMEFISLKDFLTLPFINPYSKCIVYNLDNEDKLLSEAKIKDLIVELKAGKYEELQEEYYVTDLMPGVGISQDNFSNVRIPYGLYYIYLKRY